MGLNQLRRQTIGRRIPHFYQLPRRRRLEWVNGIIGFTGMNDQADTGGIKFFCALGV